MAKKDTQLEEEIIDLTELIEPGDQGSAKAAPATASAAAKDTGSDNFEDILAETASSPVRKTDNSGDSLDMSGMGGIDNLLESLDIPPQPREMASDEASSPKQAADDELDSVLEDLLGSEKPAPESASGGKTDTSTSGQKDITGPDLDADLDDILSSFDESPAPKPAAPKAESKATADRDNLLDTDLDDILAEMEPPKAATSVPKDNPDLDDDLDTLLAEPAPKSTANAAHAPEPVSSLDDDLDDLLNEPAPKSAPGPTPERAAGFESELDDILDESVPKAASKQDSKGSVGLDGELDDLLNDVPPKAATQPKAAFDMPSKMPASDSSLPAEMRDAQAAVPPVHVQAWSPDSLAALCNNLASGQNAQEALQDFSRELGAQTAHVQDIGEQMAQMAKRLLACESKLAAARSRIAALEKGLESAAALEDLLKQGNPLHAGFMALISSAVANALKSVSLANAGGSLKSDVEQLAASFRNTDARIADLEKSISVLSDESGLKDEMAKMDANICSTGMRIEKLERRVAELGDSAVMEKTAAAAVAHVLHEEITRLAQG